MPRGQRGSCDPSSKRLRNAAAHHSRRRPCRASRRRAHRHLQARARSCGARQRRRQDGSSIGAVQRQGIRSSIRFRRHGNRHSARIRCRRPGARPRSRRQCPRRPRPRRPRRSRGPGRSSTTHISLHGNRHSACFRFRYHRETVRSHSGRECRMQLSPLPALSFLLLSPADLLSRERRQGRRGINHCKAHQEGQWCAAQ